MDSYWTTKTTLRHENIRVEFQWYMEDTRDAMNDSWKPQMSRNPHRNRIALYDHSRNLMQSAVNVPADLGNYYYKYMKKNLEQIEEIFDECYLDVCAYYDDFDSYSDIYKDINGFRPRPTKEEWELIVHTARNRKVK